MNTTGQAERPDTTGVSREIPPAGTVLPAPGSTHTGGGVVWALVRSMRFHQWSKNLLLFVPIVAGHRWADRAAIIGACVAFVVWGLMASAVYLFNDIYDIEADRAHPEKCRRPLASGQLGLTTAVIASLVLGISGIILAGAVLTPQLGPTVPITRWWLLGYTCLSMAYVFYLKRRLLVDVLALATLYTMRIMAGGAATGILISHWLLAFSMFFFASLAFAKRYTEISAQTSGSADLLPGRGYQAKDLDVLRVVGPTNGYLAIFVLAIYINGLMTPGLAPTTAPGSPPAYGHPEYLWLACPLLAYWVTRIWFIANRGQLHHDPVVFALRDPRSYFIGALCLAVVFAATL